MPSIKEEILKRLSEEEIKPEEQEGLFESFTELSLDGTNIEKISEEDKAFLEQFKNLESIQLNMTRLQSLENFPKIDTLQRVELAENFLKGEELKQLLQNENLTVLRLAKNKISSMDDLKLLSGLKKLENIDLVENPICKDESYKRDAIFENIPSLNVLDYVYKNGDEYESEDEDDFEDGFEGGEEELEALKSQLTEEQLEELKKQGITPEQYLMGIGDDLFEYGEEGEEENDEADEGDKDSEDQGNAEKKPKLD